MGGGAGGGLGGGLQMLEAQSQTKQDAPLSEAVEASLALRDYFVFRGPPSGRRFSKRPGVPLLVFIRLYSTVLQTTELLLRYLNSITILKTIYIHLYTCIVLHTGYCKHHSVAIL